MGRELLIYTLIFGIIINKSLGANETEHLSETDEVYTDYNSEVDGPRFAALVSGETSDPGSHPWHVGLVREESKTGFLGWVRHLGGLIRTTTYCGATLVSSRWLVTAAHCLKKEDRPVDIRVVMGNSKRAKYFYYFFQTDSVDQIHIHPQYNTESHNYDIALLRLKKLPDISPGELWPVCLPAAPVETYAGQSATVVGWGRTKGRPGSTPRYLQELEVTIISQAKCQEQWSYGKGRVEVGGPKMCFESTGASCHGDSGGGMFINKGNREELVGVCSYGLADCLNWAPEVYTKVSYVIDWITKTIEGDDVPDDVNMDGCGVTFTQGESETARNGRSWSEWYNSMADKASNLWKLSQYKK